MDRHRIGRWGLALAGVAGLAAACAPVKAGPLQTAVFGCANGAQTWVVPAGVTQATFDLFGAQGGAGGKFMNNAGGPGGLGGRA